MADWSLSFGIYWGAFKRQVCCPVLEASMLPLLPGWRRSMLTAVDELDWSSPMATEDELSAKNSNFFTQHT